MLADVLELVVRLEIHRAFSHAQARPLASLVALAASVPVWKLMGLIQ